MLRQKVLTSSAFLRRINKFNENKEKNMNNHTKIVQKSWKEIMEKTVENMCHTIITFALSSTVSCLRPAICISS